MYLQKHYIYKYYQEIIRTKYKEKRITQKRDALIFLIIMVYVLLAYELRSLVSYQNMH